MHSIRKAIDKGVLEAKPPIEATTVIDVMGKSADAVAAEIVSTLGIAPSEGCVLVLQGLSGTGKGTTVLHPPQMQRTRPHAHSTCLSRALKRMHLVALHGAVCSFIM